jgi:hypothetical protein
MRWKSGAPLFGLILSACVGLGVTQPDGVESGPSPPSDSPSPAYVLVRPRWDAPSQLLTVDLVEAGAPIGTPVPLSVPGGPLSGPLVIAVSQDGSHLYAISLIDEGDVPNPRYQLTVLDPENPVPDQGSAVITDYFDEIGGATFPPLAVTADGGFAYVLGNSSISTYDATRRELLPEVARVPNCGPASLMPLAGTRRLAVLCVASQEVHLLQIGASGEPEERVSVPFPVVPDDRGDSFGNPFRLGNAHWAVITPDRTKFWIVTGNGHVFEVNSQSGVIAEVADLGLSPQDWVPYSDVSLSADGGTMLVGLQDISARRGGDSTERIMFVDTDTWVSLGTVQVDSSLAWLTIDGRGNVYALAQDTRELIVFDGGIGGPRVLPVEGEPLQLVVMH